MCHSSYNQHLWISNGELDYHPVSSNVADDHPKNGYHPNETMTQIFDHKRFSDVSHWFEQALNPRIFPRRWCPASVEPSQFLQTPNISSFFLFTTEIWILPPHGHEFSLSPFFGCPSQWYPFCIHEKSKSQVNVMCFQAQQSIFFPIPGFSSSAQQLHHILEALGLLCQACHEDTLIPRPRHRRRSSDADRRGSLGRNRGGWIWGFGWNHLMNLAGKGERIGNSQVY